MSRQFEKQVLLAGFSRQERSGMESSLRKLGIFHETAHDREGIIACVGRGKCFLFVLDLAMPGILLGELLDTVFRKDPGAVVLLVLDKTKEASAAEIFMNGVVGLMLKPVASDVFERSVSQSLSAYRRKRAERSQHLRYLREISRIREIQSENLPDFSGLNGLDMAFSILPAEEMSGDILDSFPDGEGRQIVFLCDVNGHGIASSYIGMEIRALFRLSYRDGMNPGDLLREVNRSLVSRRSCSSYMSTAAVCVIEADRSHIRYASAGHPASLLWSSSAGTLTEVKPRGTMLSVSESAAYETHTVPFGEDDMLVIHSDGISEAKCEGGEMFQISRLKDTFRDSLSRENGISGIIIDVIGAVSEYTDYAIQEDDITLAVIRRKAASSQP